MTLSKDDQDNNADLALRLMLQALPEDGSYGLPWVDGDKGPFSSVLFTTWESLVRKGFVKEHTFNRYQLMGAGWIAALKISGKFDGEELKKNAGKLRAALRKRLGDRRAGTKVARNELEKETGLSEGFIYNAIDSHLLSHLFNCRDAYWATDDAIMKNHIEVPRDFGLPVD